MTWKENSERFYIQLDNNKIGPFRTYNEMIKLMDGYIAERTLVDSEGVHETEYLEIPDDVNIQEFIESNMVDDPTFEKILLEAESEVKEMPSCIEAHTYIDSKLRYSNYHCIIQDYEDAIEQLKLDKEEYIKNIRNSLLEEYEKDYIPKYRRELRKWYFKNHPSKNNNYTNPKYLNGLTHPEWVEEMEM
jgi:uncharacterized protein YlbG (UPF0298 family)